MSWPKRCFSARTWPAVNDQSICRSARAARHAEQQELRDPGLEVLLDLAQQRVGAFLVHPGQAGYGFRTGDALGDEQRLDQLIELYVHLARQGANMLVLTQAAQIERAHAMSDNSK